MGFDAPASDYQMWAWIVFFVILSIPARYAGSNDELCGTNDVHYGCSAFPGRTETPCRGFGSAPRPASTFLVVSQLAWPNMAIEWM